MEYNYSTFAFILEASCIDNSLMNIFEQYGFLSTGDYIRGYIHTDQIASFILEFDQINFIQDCLIDWDYEYLVPLEAKCNAKPTINLSYENKTIPNAWHLDLMTNNTSHIFSIPANNDTSYDQIDLWILDTGVYWQHNELKTVNIIDVDLNYTIANLTHPHGTGAASAAIGVNYGTTKNVPVYNYPVCRYGGTCGSSDIDKGLHVVLDHVTKRQNLGKRSVINMSFGSNFNVDPMNTALGLYYNDLFKNIVAAGGILVTSAGNGNSDACTWLYSYSPFVISVGSIDEKYNKSGFSNYGKCVDFYLFGTNVPLAYSVKDPNLVQYKSGTSFSSPSMAGIIVNLLIENPTLTKEEIVNYLYYRHKGKIIPSYKCNSNTKQCCSGLIRGTRLDEWCRKFSVFECDRTCQIKNC